MTVTSNSAHWEDFFPIVCSCVPVSRANFWNDLAVFVLPGTDGEEHVVYIRSKLWCCLSRDWLVQAYVHQVHNHRCLICGVARHFSLRPIIYIFQFWQAVEAINEEEFDSVRGLQFAPAINSWSQNSGVDDAQEALKISHIAFWCI